MRVLITIVLIFISLMAKEREISPLPLPTTYFINLDIYPCDSYCLREHLQRGEIFSFLAKAEGTKAFAKEYAQYAGLFHAGYTFLFTGKEIKIAVVTDRKRLLPLINNSIRTIYVTLLKSNHPFSVKQYDINDKNIKQKLQSLDPDTLIIALIPYTQKDLLKIFPYDKPLFVPTLNEKFIQSDRHNIFFGGIDYEKQIDILLKYSQKPLALFYISHLELSKKLTDLVSEKKDQVKLINLKDGAKNLNRIISVRSLRRKNLFLNTPLIQTALILSQLTLHKYNYLTKFSTQINYHSRLFQLTQDFDRKNLIIANSILYPQKDMVAATSIYNINLYYDWISYAQIIGIETLLTPEIKTSKEEFFNNQIDYDVELLRYFKNGFHQIYQESSEESSQVDHL